VGVSVTLALTLSAEKPVPPPNTADAGARAPRTQRLVLRLKSRESRNS
jgi:hypothetical protein